MNATLTGLLDTIQRAIANPGANLVLTSLLLAGAALVGLIVVMLMLLVITPRKRRVVKHIRRIPRAELESDAADDEDTYASTAVVPVVVEPTAEVESDLEVGDTPAALTQPDSTRSQAAKIWSAVSIPLLLLLALASAYVVTGTTVFCAETCHGLEESVRMAADVNHSSCVSCHESRGVGGIVPNTVSRARMAVQWLSGAPSPSAAIVASDNCSSCHRSVLEATTDGSRGVRMSHAEPLEAAMACTSCHSRTGHSDTTDYAMSSCVTCHDGDRASTECDTCHVEDPYDATVRVGDDASDDGMLGAGDITYPLVQLRGIECGGCHEEQTQCDSCHGLRMPHDATFKRFGHARLAAFEKKQMCYEQCHTPGSCQQGSGCHVGFPGHGTEWKEGHKRMPWDAGCGCHAARSGRDFPMCELCH